MCMRSIDNNVDIVSRVPSRTRKDALLIDHSLRTRMPCPTNSLLVLMGVHGNAQETLTRGERHCESRRRAMFPHFFSCTKGSLRTSFPKSSSQSTSCDGLWIARVGSRASTWVLSHESDTGSEGVSDTRSGRAGSTSAGAPAPSKATAKTAHASYQSCPHTTARTFVECESLEAEFHGKDGRCL